MRKKIFQTLEDRGNPIEIEKCGPYRCTWKNTWLGHGHYFWDTFVENAHFWGSQRRFKGRYVICEATFEYSLDTCFDLVGTTEHIEDFRKSHDLLCEKLNTSKITVVRVLEFMKQTNTFKYHATRAWGMQTKSISKNKYRVMFELLKNSKRPQYLDTKPAIQISIYNLDAVNFNGVSIIHPDHYISGYAV